MIRGSCLCGGVRYRAEGPLSAVSRCHCLQCRKASGAEFATNASVAAEGFAIEAGADLLSEYQSSPGQARVFCGRCGSPIVKRSAAVPEVVRIRMGCLDVEVGQGPALHVFVSEQPAWSPVEGELPRFDTLPGR